VDLGNKEINRTSMDDSVKGKYSEEYMVQNMKMGNGKLERTEN
jgi:hypothetical protein